MAPNVPLIAGPERLDRWDGDTLVYRLRPPLASGETPLILTPLERLPCLAALVPPPRRHAIHYYGALSAHAKPREKVIESAGPSGADHRLYHRLGGCEADIGAYPIAERTAGGFAI